MQEKQLANQETKESTEQSREDKLGLDIIHI